MLQNITKEFIEFESSSYNILHYAAYSKRLRIECERNGLLENLWLKVFPPKIAHKFLSYRSTTHSTPML